MAGTIVANTINTDTGVFTSNNAYTGVSKAWVQFVGSTVAINGSFNVSSITRNSTGYYTINFATALSNANYSMVGNAAYVPSTAAVFVEVFTNSAGASVAPTTTSATAYVVGWNGVSYDSPYVNIAVFGA